MPQYDYRCKQCGERFSLFYKTYADYDAAAPLCPNCESDQLARLITSVTVARPSRNYSKMNSNEMLSVLESGDSRQVGEMFQQIGGSDPRLGKQYHDATQRLIGGETKDSVEQDLRSQSKGGETTSSE